MCKKTIALLILFVLSLSQSMSQSGGNLFGQERRTRFDFSNYDPGIHMKSITKNFEGRDDYIVQIVSSFSGHKRIDITKQFESFDMDVDLIRLRQHNFSGGNFIRLPDELDTTNPRYETALLFTNLILEKKGGHYEGRLFSQAVLSTDEPETWTRFNQNCVRLGKGYEKRSINSSVDSIFPINERGAARQFAFGNKSLESKMRAKEKVYPRGYSLFCNMPLVTADVVDPSRFSADRLYVAFAQAQDHNSTPRFKSNREDHESVKWKIDFSFEVVDGDYTKPYLQVSSSDSADSYLRKIGMFTYSDGRWKAHTNLIFGKRFPNRTTDRDLVVRAKRIVDTAAAKMDE